MPKEKEITLDEPKGFSKTVQFVAPFEGELNLATRMYRFKVTRRDLYPLQKDGSRSKIKVPVEKVIDNEAVYNWLKKFEAIRA